MKRKETDEEGKARALDRRDRTTVVMERSLSNDLREALKNLSVSQKRVKAVADLALMNSRDYKEIVHEIEKHISRTSAEKRLAGIYVVDAIIRGVRRVVSIIPLRENSPTSPPHPTPSSVIVCYSFPAVCLCTPILALSDVVVVVILVIAWRVTCSLRR